MADAQLIEHAQELHRRGFAVVPIPRAGYQYRDRDGEIQEATGKGPIFPGWQQRRLTWEELEAQLKADHVVGIGVVAGAASNNLAVLDFDGDGWQGAFEHFQHSWEKLERAPIASTGSGRRHIWLRCPDMHSDFTHHDFARTDLHAVIDLRGNRSNCMAPPSLHPSGEYYRWVSTESELVEVPFEDLYTWLAEWSGQPAERQGPAAPVEDVLQPGARRPTLMSLAGTMRRRGLGYDEILPALLAINEKRCRPVLPIAEIEKIAKGVLRYDPAEVPGAGETKAKGKKSQAEIMVELALERDITLFLDQGDEPHAAFPVGDHREIAGLDSRRFGWWLRGLLFESAAKSGYHQAVKSAIGVLSAMAAFRDPQHRRLWNRVAWGLDGALWYDLADAHWRAVRITTQGWEIVDSPPILFQRFAHQKEQVEPARVAAAEAPEILNKLWQLVNLPACERPTEEPDQRLLYLGYLGTTAIPDIPHPIPITTAVQGAGKTVMAKATRELVDPSHVGLLSFSRDGGELIQALSHHWCAYFDNVSSIPGWIQDILCRAATGEGFSKRKLWTDDEDVIYSFRRCVALNGINVSASRGDLFDRAILFQLNRFTDATRRTEHELWPIFEQLKPQLLGALFITLSGALRQDEATAIALARQFRMADFAAWGYRFCEALGRDWGNGFVNAYGLSIGKRSVVALESHPLGVAVRVFMDSHEGWEGTPAALLETLEMVAAAEKIDTSARAWPGSASWLGRRLREVQVDLEQVGIQVGEKRDGRQRTITLQKAKKANGQ